MNVGSGAQPVMGSTTWCDESGEHFQNLVWETGPDMKLSIVLELNQVKHQNLLRVTLVTVALKKPSHPALVRDWEKNLCFCFSCKNTQPTCAVLNCMHGL
eukprot:TRINITY_DN4437_c1_g1_i4.p1 TRINITY_DN4437_c1_g1~~TRINITY_DN4437_c1_g1_i4.p1  ORF type:complete len:100 (+),score=0.46 TRINITY_DN4437_c1_g1_i4:111-410(+)